MSKKNPDTCFYSFAEPVEVQGDLRALLPSHIVAAADWGTCEAVPAGLIRPESRARHADRLFRVAAGATRIYVYLLLVEAEGEDRLLALELFWCITAFWERHVLQNPGAESLPAVIPVVLYHGERRWHGEPRFSALYDQELWKQCKEYLLDFEFLIHHLSDHR